MDYSNIDQQIKDVERTIEQGDERVRDLKASLWPATKELVRRNRKPLLIALGVIVVSAVVLYPRRHKILGSMRKLANHPVGKMFMAQLPLAGVIWPLLQGDGASARRGMFSKALLWLARFIPHGVPSQEAKQSKRF